MDRVVFACRITLAAPDASFRAEGQFFFGRNGFGIMAPGAMQGAAFQEDRGTDARSVID